MSHLQAAIFSPTAARAAASAQQDWSLVETWLSSRFGSQKIPPFERSPDTLRALLALVSANETADDERDLLCAVEADALAEIDEHWDKVNNDVRGGILDQIEDNLTREGRAALEALAGTSVVMGAAGGDVEGMGRSMGRLNGQVFEIDTASERVEVLRKHVEGECVRLRKMLEEAGGEGYRPSADLAKRNLEVQRRLKIGSVTTAATGGSKKAGAGREVDGPEGLTAEEVRGLEEEVLLLVRVRNELDAKVNAFQGLPADTDAARQELERFGDELAAITSRRDAVFEGLVERQTPRKPRR